MAQHEQLFCSLDTEGGPGMGGHGIQSFQAQDGRVHFNLLGWNGQGAAPNLFPEARTS